MREEKRSEEREKEKASPYGEARASGEARGAGEPLCGIAERSGAKSKGASRCNGAEHERNSQGSGLFRRGGEADPLAIGGSS
jgi:hypothetical protein